MIHEAKNINARLKAEETETWRRKNSNFCVILHGGVSIDSMEKIREEMWR